MILSSMLKLQNIKIEYNKLILKQDELIIPSIGLTIIEGESGSGKSSLLRCLSLKEDTCEQYVYNHKIIKNKDEFKKKYLSVLEQEQCFIDTLLIKDHIQLIKKAYAFDNISYYLEKLQLNELLNKYPNQLSGGEKTRVSLLLKIMKQPEIFILDEPTASLDLEYTHRVLDILKDYAREHAVIIATHDQEVIQEANTLYKIENQRLVTVKNDNQKEDDIKDISLIEKKVAPISALSLNLYLKKKNRLLHILFYLFLSVVMFLSSSYLSSISEDYSTNHDKMNQVYQDELLIYTNPTEYEYYQLDGTGREFPITQEELELVSQIDNIENITPAYLIGTGSNLLEVSSYLDYDETELQTIRLLDKSQKNITTIDINEVGYYNSLLECTYDSNKDYSNDIEVQYSQKKNGVYISKFLAESIGIDKISENTYLEFILLIPTHIGYGDAELNFDANNDTSYPVAELLGKRIKVSLPINGILKSYDMGVGIKSDLSVYLPYSYMQEQIDKYKSDKTLTYYHSSQNGRYQLQLDKGDTSTNEMVCQPYTPTIYKVKVNNVQNLDKVINQLQDNGFNVIHDSVNSQLFHYYENNNQTILVVSLFVLVILVVIYGLIKYLHRKHTKQIEDFMKSFGYSEKESHRNIRCQYLIDTFIVYMLVLIISSIYLYGLSERLNYPISVFPIFVLYTAILSLVIMYIVPLLALRFGKE